MMDKHLRDIYDKAIQQARDKEDRTKTLIRDLEDAQKDFEDYKQDQNALGMLRAQKKMQEARDELAKLYPQP